MKRPKPRLYKCKTCGKMARHAYKGKCGVCRCLDRDTRTGKYQAVKR